MRNPTWTIRKLIDDRSRSRDTVVTIDIRIAVYDTEPLFNAFATIRRTGGWGDADEPIAALHQELNDRLGAACTVEDAERIARACADAKWIGGRWQF
jgi:hypothetical protein